MCYLCRERPHIRKIGVFVAKIETEYEKETDSRLDL
jgi:hypothetical protein